MSAFSNPKLVVFEVGAIAHNLDSLFVQVSYKGESVRI